MVCSVVVVNLPKVGFEYATHQLYWLAALPGLSGATLRVFYSFTVPIFGGRRWTAVSTAFLLVPSVWIGLAVQNPETPYTVMLTLAFLCGLGGGNFASSMAHISFLYPQSLIGTALGLNAGLGNLGVSLVQFVVPWVITLDVFGALGGDPHGLAQGQGGEQIWLQNAGFIWVPFICLSSLAAWLGMNDIPSARASFKEQAVMLKRKHTWLMCWLYTGTFGSFIGYSAALPLLISVAFPEVNATQYAFLGPLVGALFRVVGGWIADQLGGARVTFWSFLVMVVAVTWVLGFLPDAQGSGNFQCFLAAFLLMFAAAGIGSGSTFRMISVIFMTEHLRAVAGAGQAAITRAQRDGAIESAAVLGLSSALAAYGAFFIPTSFGTSITMTGGVEVALYLFLAFYTTCIAITWCFYTREGAEAPC